METNYFVHYLVMLDIIKLTETNRGFKEAVAKLSNDEITDIINKAIAEYPDEHLQPDKKKLSSLFWVYIFSIAFPAYIDGSVHRKKSNTVNTKTANVTIIGFDEKKTISQNNKAPKDLDNFIKYNELPED